MLREITKSKKWKNSKQQSDAQCNHAYFPDNQNRHHPAPARPYKPPEYLHLKFLINDETILKKYTKFSRVRILAKTSRYSIIGFRYIKSLCR